MVTRGTVFLSVCQSDERVTRIGAPGVEWNGTACLMQWGGQVGGVEWSSRPQSVASAASPQRRALSPV